MRFPLDVEGLLDHLLPAIQESLPDNLVAVYVRGSLTDGSFVEGVSDVDLLAITDRPPADAEFTVLASAHRRVAGVRNPYAEEVEIAYVDRGAVRRFEPGRRHPTLYRHEPLVWSEHRENWILERWAVRERGIVLVGPDPRTLVDVVTEVDVRAAVRSELRNWADWARHPEDPGWVSTRGQSAYVVETMCRALDTLRSGELHSKREAVDRALRTMPEPWRSTVVRSQQWRTDSTPDRSLTPEVMAFVAWAATEAAAGDGNVASRG